MKLFESKTLFKLNPIQVPGSAQEWRLTLHAPYGMIPIMAVMEPVGSAYPQESPRPVR